MIDVLWEPAQKPKKYQATIIASGGPVPHAVEAAKALASKGFAVRAADASTLAPFDAAAIVRFAADSQRLVAVEDHDVDGGLGSAVSVALAESGLACPVVRVGPHGLDAAGIAEACLMNL
jgi:transketolase